LQSLTPAPGRGVPNFLGHGILQTELHFVYLENKFNCNMKLLLLAAGLLFSTILFSQADDEKEIRKILNNQNDAWNRGDVEAFMVGYWENDSLMFIGSSGITYGYKNTLANYKKRYPDTAAMGRLTFELKEVKRLSAEYYHVAGKWSLNRSRGDISGHFTLLFRKINDRWMIISDHSS
jgi:ketosteroid isomerase-like protein